jgi:nitroreductase
VETTRFLRDLRAVRRFDSRPVPDEVLADVLEVARWTGSAKNAQPWKLVVVSERDTLKSLAKLGRFAGHVGGAPLAIALVLSERSRSRSFDEGRIAERIMLAAWAHGVGSCVATIFPEANEDKAAELLGAPPGCGLRTVLSLGYPADEKARFLSSTPLLKRVVPVGRKPLDQIVSRERYGNPSLPSS